MVERLHAQKTRIADIMTGKFFPGSKEELRPGYSITKFGEKLSRVNIVAAIVDKFESEDGNYASITLDDGSDLIRAKVFKDLGPVKSLELGDMVLAVGKLKEYQGEIYINLEIARKVEPNYETKHKLEVLNNLIAKKTIATELRKLSDSMSEEELENYAKGYDVDKESLKAILNSKDIDYKPRILEIIESLDKGEGVDVSKIFETVKLPENIIESTLTQLLDEGFIFEPFVGKLRKI